MGRTIYSPDAECISKGDRDFHIDGNREAAGVARKIYERAGAADKFCFIEGPEGHRYYAALSWLVVHEMFV